MLFFGVGLKHIHGLSFIFYFIYSIYVFWSLTLCKTTGSSGFLDQSLVKVVSNRRVSSTHRPS